MGININLSGVLMFDDDKYIKKIELQGVDIAYREIGEGRPVLLLHGIASSFYTWKSLTKNMDGDCKYIILDLNSNIASDSKDVEDFYSFNQTQVVIDFINHFDLKDITLVGHAMGGTIALLSLFNKDIIKRVSNLVLIDVAGMFVKLPDFIANFIGGLEEDILLKYSKARKDLLPNMILKEFYFDSKKITPEILEAYSNHFESDESKRFILSALRQFQIANFSDFYNRLQLLRVNTLIIWGEEDRIIDIEEAFYLKNAIENSSLKIIPKCGHCPQEEMPLEAAKEILQFLGGSVEAIKRLEKLRKEQELKDSASEDPKSEPAAPLPLFHEVKMSKLFKGNWNVVTFFFFIIIKMLQFFRKYSGLAKKNGWRKITEIFLRKEHSKFCLASFRLSYDSEKNANKDFSRAKQLLVAKMYKFIKNSPILHWSVEQGAFSVTKKANDYVDIMVAEFNSNGELLTIDPYFEFKKEENVYILSVTQTDILAKILIRAYNETRNLSDKKRLKVLNRKLYNRLANEFEKVSEQISVRHYGLRVLQATFITFEHTKEISEKHLSKERLATPDFLNLKHPGAGLLNIYCRFPPDLLEADLWFQYHHVPVDGMPMQEMLDKLKAEWGAAGPVIYPPVGSEDAAPEITFAGEGIYRGKLLCSFGEILKVRKILNNDHYNDMGGPAPLPALLMWGIANHKDFKGYKFSMPVDTALLDAKGVVNERNISLIFIQPQMFFDPSSKLGGLIKFIREFNRLIALTRVGKSESYEFLELAGIMHPAATAMLQKFFPNSFSRVIGNGGLTIIKDSEMFITPLTELQEKGFIAIGNCRMQTSDGKYGGFVSVCGSKELVKTYINTLSMVTNDFLDYLPKECF